MHWYHWAGIAANALVITLVIIELKDLIRREK
jgi:hypothetical protein